MLRRRREADPLIDPMQAFATGLSLIGLVLNVFKRRSCFLVWLASNVLLAAWAADRAAWGMVATQVAFAVISAWGFVTWRGAQPKGGRP